MIPFLSCLFCALIGFCVGMMMKPDQVTKVSYGVEIEDDGETTVFYFEAPEHKGKIKSVLVGDCDRVRVFEEKEII